MRRAGCALRTARLWLAAAGLGLALALLWVPLETHPAQAAGGPPEFQAQEPTPVPNQSISNETCLSCHGQPGISLELPSGETWSLYVPDSLFHRSVHSQQGIACVQCHTSVGNYPHPPFEAASIRDAQLQLYPLCQRCHTGQFEANQDSVHAAARAEGKPQAAVCVDCHTAHLTRRLTEPGPSREPVTGTRIWVAQTCANCHYAIYQQYAGSVHGQALIQHDNPDVPTCTDCHGVHSIDDPTTAAFRLRSPEICAECHTNPAIMDKYGISTNVLDTYVADFHGTTITLFAKQHPDQEINTPVCYDCHGVHNIAATDDPQKGLQVKENLLARCQVCHPDASENFPTAWLSHYIPSPQKYPIVYWVNIFYTIFIPTVLGGMAILVVMDYGAALREKVRRAAGRLRKPRPAESAEKAGNVLIVAEPAASSEASASESVEPLEAHLTETAAPPEVPEAEPEPPAAGTSSEPPSTSAEPTDISRRMPDAQVDQAAQEEQAEDIDIEEWPTKSTEESEERADDQTGPGE